MREAAIYMTRAGFAIRRASERLGDVWTGRVKLPINCANRRRDLEIGDESRWGRDPPSKTAQVETTLGPQCSACAWLGRPLVLPCSILN